LNVERKTPQPYTVTEICKNFCFRPEGTSKISPKQNLQVNSAPLEGCHYSVWQNWFNTKLDLHERKVSDFVICKSYCLFVTHGSLLWTNLTVPECDLSSLPALTVGFKMWVWITRDITINLLLFIFFHKVSDAEESSHVTFALLV
jgi:hypothetical protein